MPRANIPKKPPCSFTVHHKGELYRAFWDAEGFVHVRITDDDDWEYLAESKDTILSARTTAHGIIEDYLNR